MRVLVTGARDYVHRRLIWTILDGFLAQAGADEEVVVIEGQCPKGGADKFAEEWAKAHAPRVDHLPFPADWKRFAKSAGPIRNRRMLKEGRPTVVLAFHDDLAHSSGTKNMVEIAERAVGVTVIKIARSLDAPVQGALLEGTA